MGIADLKKKDQAKPTLATLRASKNGKANKPAGLAALRAQKKANGGLAAMRKQKDVLRKASSKLDFADHGILYHNVRQHGEWWTVDVSTGDVTITFHNRHGSWMHDIVEREGHMREPQPEVKFGINKRWRRELKMRGIPMPEDRGKIREQERIAREKAEKAAAAADRKAARTASTKKPQGGALAALKRKKSG